MVNTKKNIKKIFAFLLCIAVIGCVFAGCSKSGEADEITDKTMLIAYTEEVEPFLYKDKNGKLTGFDVDLFEKIYDNVKNDTKNYKFVKVDKDYKVGDDIAYTDKKGTEYIAYTMIGAVQKNVGSVNEDFSFTDDIITNKIITNKVITRIHKPPARSLSLQKTVREIQVQSERLFVDRND